MDNDLKEGIKEIKNLVSKGNNEKAIDIINSLINNDDFKPYVNALKKIKVDIIYALNLEHIEPDIGKKAHDKVISELDSAIGENSENTVKKPEPNSKNVNPIRQNTHKIMLTPYNPIFFPPVVSVTPPQGEQLKDPYDIDNINIEDEIGPMGLLNDIRRTIQSITDPTLPMKILKKGSTNKQKK